MLDETRFRLLGLAMLLICAKAWNLEAQPSAQKQNNPPPATTLELGQPLDREISSGQRESYQISLSTGQFATVSIQQRGVDVFERVFAPDGKLVAEFNDELRPQEPERAEFVAETSGVYRLEIAPKFNFGAGRYQIRLAEVRLATDLDGLLHEAHKLVTQVADLDRVGKYDDALPLAERALKVSEELGPDDPYAGHMLNQLGHVYLKVGSYNKAKELYQRALVSNQKTRGPCRHSNEE